MEKRDKMDSVYFFKNAWESNQLICVTSFSKTYRAKMVNGDGLSAITSIILKTNSGLELDTLYKKYNEIIKDLKTNYIPNIVPIFQYEILKNKKKQRITINLRYRLEDGSIKNIERLENKIKFFEIANENNNSESVNEEVVNEPEVKETPEQINEPEIVNEPVIEKREVYTPEQEESSQENNTSTKTEPLEENVPYFAANYKQTAELETDDDSDEDVLVINKTTVTYKEETKKKSFFSADFYLWLLVIISILMLILFIYKGYSLVK